MVVRSFMVDEVENQSGGEFSLLLCLGVLMKTLPKGFNQKLGESLLEEI